VAHILSISYDQLLLRTRQLLFESCGYRVTSAFEFQAAVHACEQVREFDLLIVGHTVPLRDKQQLMKIFREFCNAPVITLERVNDELVEAADYHCDTNPQALLDLVAKILKNKLPNQES
jgi:DNA-binding response OmpR family regulator